jgi:hypothetical protein
MKFLDVPQSGSYAGGTHSHNRAGQYRRNRRSPVQPVGSGRRAFVRAALSAASTGWSALTDLQRAAWDSFALDHPVTNSLGQSIILTGHQMYVRVGTLAQNVGDALPTTPPTTTDVWTPGTVTLTAAAGTPALSVAWDAGTAGDWLLIAFSPPASPGRSFVSRYWQATAVDAAATPYNGLAAFTGEFGTLIAGQRIFVKATPINADDWPGTAVIASGVVAA